MIEFSPRLLSDFKLMISDLEVTENLQASAAHQVDCSAVEISSKQPNPQSRLLFTVIPTSGNWRTQVGLR